MSYSTLPGQLGPILYSSVILQTILCLVLFLLFVSCFPLTRRLNWIRFFVFYHVLHLIFCCIWLRLCVPQLALSSCTQIQCDEPAPQCFFLFLEQSTEFINWNTVSTHFSPLGQSPTVPASSSEAPPRAHIPSYMQVWLGFKYYSADFPQPLWGQVHCVDYLYNSRE